MNLGEFLHMGGYAPYVWGSWGLMMVSILTIFILAKRRNARIRQRLIVQLERKEKFKL